MIRVAYVNAGYGDTYIETEHLTKAGFALDVYEGLKPDEIVEAVKDADAVVVTLQKLSGDIIRALPKLKVICRMGVGTDSVDLETATACGIPVIYVPDYCIEEVALQAVSLLLAAHRKLVPANRLVQARRWAAGGELKPIHALSGLTLGLLGMGRIGGKVIELMRPFTQRIIVSDPYVKPDQLPSGVELVSLDELWAQIDILSIHCPLTSDTKYIINRDTIAKMTKQPIIVNVSRGAIIHEADLLDALNNGSVRYAALDVLEQEPPADDHPLLDHPNALVTNHFAWYSAEAEVRLRELSVTRVIDFLNGRPVSTIVNRAALGV